MQMPHYALLSRSSLTLPHLRHTFADDDGPTREDVLIDILII